MGVYFSIFCWILRFWISLKNCGMSYVLPKKTNFLSVNKIFLCPSKKFSQFLRFLAEKLIPNAVSICSESGSRSRPGWSVPHFYQILTVITARFRLPAERGIISSHRRVLAPKSEVRSPGRKEILCWKVSCFSGWMNFDVWRVQTNPK